MINQILQKKRWSINRLLSRLSYKSELGINTKKESALFWQKILMDEIYNVNAWYDSCDFLYNIARL